MGKNNKKKSGSGIAIAVEGLGLLSPCEAFQRAPHWSKQLADKPHEMIRYDVFTALLPFFKSVNWTLFCTQDAALPCSDSLRKQTRYEIDQLAVYGYDARAIFAEPYVVSAQFSVDTVDGSPANVSKCIQDTLLPRMRTYFNESAQTNTFPPWLFSCEVTVGEDGHTVTVVLQHLHLELPCLDPIGDFARLTGLPQHFIVMASEKEEMDAYKTQFEHDTECQARTCPTMYSLRWRSYQIQCLLYEAWRTPGGTLSRLPEKWLRYLLETASVPPEAQLVHFSFAQLERWARCFACTQPIHLPPEQYLKRCMLFFRRPSEREKSTVCPRLATLTMHCETTDTTQAKPQVKIPRPNEPAMWVKGLNRRQKRSRPFIDLDALMTPSFTRDGQLSEEECISKLKSILL